MKAIFLICAIVALAGCLPEHFLPLPEHGHQEYSKTGHGHDWEHDHWLPYDWPYSSMDDCTLTLKRTTNFSYPERKRVCRRWRRLGWW